MTSHITAEQKSNRNYKDTFFRKLYHDENRALELYNAVDDADYPVGTPVRFYSVGDESITRRNNDIAFTINEQLLVIIDHQGSLNPNMPLRLLPNATEILYTWLEDKRNIYGSRLVTIPTPKFYVLYNGKDKLEYDVLRLSDAFKVDGREFSLELVVKVLDVNYSSNHKVLTKSPSLGGYAYLIEEIRRHMNEGISRDISVARAVMHCIEKGILAEFLNEYYREVCDMLAWECTIEDEMDIRTEQAMEIGMEKGIIAAALKFLAKGMNLQDVIDTLELTDEHIEQLKLATI